MQLARRCQRIEQALKEANRSKVVQDRIAEQNAMRRNNGSTRTIVNTPAGAAPPANSNPMSTQMARISQPQAQLAAPSNTNTNTNSATLATPRLTSEEMDRLRKFNQCFNCKKKRHATRNCTKPSRPYSAVSASLQEVTIVEKNSASESEKT